MNDPLPVETVGLGQQQPEFFQCLSFGFDYCLSKVVLRDICLEFKRGGAWLKNCNLGFITEKISWQKSFVQYLPLKLIRALMISHTPFPFENSVVD